MKLLTEQQETRDEATKNTEYPYTNMRHAISINVLPWAWLTAPRPLILVYFSFSSSFSPLPCIFLYFLLLYFYLLFKLPQKFEVNGMDSVVLIV